MTKIKEKSARMDGYLTKFDGGKK